MQGQSLSTPIIREYSEHAILLFLTAAAAHCLGHSDHMPCDIATPLPMEPCVSCMVHLTERCLQAAALQQLDSASRAMQDSLNAELKGKHDFSVHIASPGMVATELLLGGEEKDQRAAKIINILAEEAEVVAAWMVPRMRGVRRSGKYFKCGPSLTVALWLLLVVNRRRAREATPGLPCFCCVLLSRVSSQTCSVSEQVSDAKRSAVALPDSAQPQGALHTRAA